MQSSSFMGTQLKGQQTRATRTIVRSPVMATAGPIILPTEPKLDLPPKYCESIHATKRRPTRTVMIGKVPVGSQHPIAKQTMTTTDTRDIMKTVDQVIKCADAGADIVRITVQGRKEAEACFKIREELFKRRYDIPLVADIHFQPSIAMMVAEAFEKIRINPGNFADGAKKFEDKTYDTDAAYEAELEHIEEVFTPLVEKCKKLGRAMRIGTNHGSLSARTLGRYGDTPRGMVESAFEFARICRKHDYHNFVFSMKASNPLVMVQAYRLLAAEMYNVGWDYPLHLGVTEAGEGEDGRMKSAIGIGALLMDGLGDTIRVSLTEDPEYEIDPCGRLAKLGEDACARNLGVEAFEEVSRDFRSFERRKGSLPVKKDYQAVISSGFDVAQMLHRDGSVFSAVKLADVTNGKVEKLYRDLGCKLSVGMPFKDLATSDSILLREAPAESDKAARLALKRLQDVGVGLVVPYGELVKAPIPNAVTLHTLRDAAAAVKASGKAPLAPQTINRLVVSVDGTESEAEVAAIAQIDPVAVLLNIKPSLSRLHASRRVFDWLARHNVSTPVIHHIVYPKTADRDEIVIRGGSEVGGLLVDGLGDGVLMEHEGEDLNFLRTTSFGMLQGSRMRNTKTEYVSCPSCGRTLFDLQEVTEQIRTRTGHLPGVAIAVMGCIVNGPGEMADADFGYVGGAPGKIDLYVGKEVVKKGIPMESATDELVQLIKDNGRWVDKEVEEEAAPAAAN